MRVDDDSPYREGVVLNRPTKPGWGSLVDCGMRKEVKIDKCLKPGVRVTVKINQIKPGEVKSYLRGFMSLSRSPI